MEIDEQMARTIFQMGEDLLSEELLRDEEMEVLFLIREEFPDTAEDFPELFHRVEK